MYAAFLAFEQLSLPERIDLLNELLSELLPEDVAEAVKDPERLGLMAEARLIGLPTVDQLMRYLPLSDQHRLAALVNEALIARLPER